MSDTRLVILNILKGQINRGRRGDERYCPAGLALNRMLAPGWTAYVGTEQIDIVEIDGPPDVTLRAHTVKTTGSLREFIQQFDFNERHKPRPVSLELELPEEVLL